jgi:predicted DNA repair protein MutK
MAGTSLFALIDDIATILDDVAVMTKVAAKKTAGVLGDDLALNAQLVSGVKADRELPVVLAVAKGSAINKLIIVPAALIISAIAPWAVTPILMIGGAYLCFEGVEKVLHKFFHNKVEDKHHHDELVNALANENVDMVEFEKNKIKGAIRTDFILSAEIIVIAMAAAKDKELSVQVGVLCAIAALMTVGVYGLVAGIVKLDDIGLHLSKAKAKVQQSIGKAILWFAPWLMKFLSFAGTLAMFLVGGGILAHGFHQAEVFLHFLEHKVEHITFLHAALPLIFNAALGAIVGYVVLLVVSGVKKLKPQK